MWTALPLRDGKRSKAAYRARWASTAGDRTEQRPAWVTHHPMSDPIIIEPPVELDVASVTEFREALEDATGDASAGLIVDLSHVEFIDSSGLGVVLEARERARVEGGPFAVVAPRGTTAAVLLTLSGLRNRLPVFDSRK